MFTFVPPSGCGGLKCCPLVHPVYCVTHVPTHGPPCFACPAACTQKYLQYEIPSHVDTLMNRMCLLAGDSRAATSMVWHGCPEEYGDVNVPVQSSARLLCSI